MFFRHFQYGLRAHSDFVWIFFVQISDKLCIKQGIIEDAHLPYTLTAFRLKQSDRDDVITFPLSLP